MFRYSLKSLMLAVVFVTVLVAAVVEFAERESLVLESTLFSEEDTSLSGGSTSIQIGYTIDRWGIRSKRLAFIAVTHNSTSNQSPRIHVERGSRAVLLMPDGQEISVEQPGILFEIDGDGVRRFEERITWTEWQEFQKHETGSFRVSDLLEWKKGWNEGRGRRKPE